MIRIFWGKRAPASIDRYRSYTSRHRQGKDDDDACLTIFLSLIRCNSLSFVIYSYFSAGESLINKTFRAPHLKKKKKKPNWAGSPFSYLCVQLFAWSSSSLSPSSSLFPSPCCCCCCCCSFYDYFLLVQLNEEKSENRLTDSLPIYLVFFFFFHFFFSG